MAAVNLLPCPFCNSANVDPEGWASTERSGPACDDCGGSADTVEIWNSRPEVERLQEAKRRALSIADERAKENVALRAELERLRALAKG